MEPKKHTVYTLVHVDDDGTICRRDDGLLDYVCPIDEQADGMIFADYEEAKVSLERHNDPEEYDVNCVIVELEIHEPVVNTVA